ncbi:MAG: peroxiredoxin [Spirochaetes bacterium]|jgi:peroxiredoxin Q/BCP|nr:peroxiredoxin [Spirochaetota bacterium]
MAEIKMSGCEKAPDFTLPDQDGNTVSLKDYRGKWVVLYFYPKDNTSGCTVEAIDFTSLSTVFMELNAVIIGVSPDSCQSHQKFILKHDLGIKLLSDVEKKTLEGYGVWRIKKMYGREYFGVARTTFLIDPRGIIAHVWNKVNVKGHGEDVLSTLRELIK